MEFIDITISDSPSLYRYGYKHVTRATTTHCNGCVNEPDKLLITIYTD